jgi:hypothetical protein
MNRNLYPLIFIVCIGILFSFSSNTYSRGNCWGIFKNKAECETEYRYKRDVKVCRENSWDACERISKSNGAQYCSCLDRVRNSCMRSLGWSDTIGISACDSGD